MGHLKPSCVTHSTNKLKRALWKIRNELRGREFPYAAIKSKTHTKTVTCLFIYPIGSMYGIFTYIWLIFMVNVGKYTIHGW